jgi:hypothetical protein
LKLRRRKGLVVKKIDIGKREGRKRGGRNSKKGISR